MSQTKRTSFVVRVAQDRCGQVSGVIERVATGAKETFAGLEAIGRVIWWMLQREGTLPRAGSDTTLACDEKPRPASGRTP